MSRPSEHLSQELQQRLQQRLNPQSVALGRVLEMSVPEFEEKVRRELDENPALEAVDTTSESHDTDFGESAEQLQLADYSDPDDAPSYLRNPNNHSADDPIFDAASVAADDSQSQSELLLRHLADESELDETDMRIAAHIIGNLDSNGYLTRPLAAIADDIAISEGIDIDMGHIRTVFNAVRSLDPAGIGAVDLRDCLLLQLDRMEPTVESLTAREIIDRYFDLFSKMHYERIQAALGISREALGNALALIKTLNPKPASGLESTRGVDRTQHVVPDFILDYDTVTDNFTLSLTGNVPELAIESTFSEEASIGLPHGDRRREALAFIKKRREDANAFIRLVEMRGQTLMAIGKAIVTIQRDFFASGDKADIKPMILKDVAALTGLDLSVISRATAGKYILTPHGQYPLKLFFNERPDSGSDVSAHAILQALNDIITGEDKRKPLSDRTLTEMLEAKGFDIARRTVAKYRERLGHPVARLRKKI